MNAEQSAIIRARKTYDPASIKMNLTNDYYYGSITYLNTVCEKIEHAAGPSHKSFLIFRVTICDKTINNMCLLPLTEDLMNDADILREINGGGFPFYIQLSNILSDNTRLLRRILCNGIKSKETDEIIDDFKDLILNEPRLIRDCQIFAKDNGNLNLAALYYLVLKYIMFHLDNKGFKFYMIDYGLLCDLILNMYKDFKYYDLFKYEFVERYFNYYYKHNTETLGAYICVFEFFHRGLCIYEDILKEQPDELRDAEKDEDDGEIIEEYMEKYGTYNMDTAYYTEYDMYYLLNKYKHIYDGDTIGIFERIVKYQSAILRLANHIEKYNNGYEYNYIHNNTGMSDRLPAGMFDRIYDRFKNMSCIFQYILYSLKDNLDMTHIYELCVFVDKFKKPYYEIINIINTPDTAHNIRDKLNSIYYMSDVVDTFKEYAFIHLR